MASANQEPLLAPLRGLVEASEDWLIHRVLDYAKAHGYAMYSSTLAEAWRASVSGLSKTICGALAGYDDAPELPATASYGDDEIARYGVQEARAHRARGVPISLFLGLLKYYRQTYQDLIDEAGLTVASERACRRFVDRVFDHVELGLCSEWSGLAETEKIREIQDHNVAITREKLKYLTIFESLRDPVILLAADGVIENMNNAACDVFGIGANPGTVYYGAADLKSGVQATCADCHVARALLPKLVRKVQAAGEVWGKLTGVIDTPEKFEAKRLEMAKHVWAGMAATDSRECRSCHAFDNMIIDKQRENAKKMHPQAIKEGETCITCHKGIAHKLPDMKGGYKKAFQELVAAGGPAVDKAERVFTVRSKPLFLDKADAKPDGKGDGVLLPATEVQVLERSGDFLKVRIDGWQQDGVPQMIYAASGKRIFTAALGKQAESAVAVKNSMVDPETEQRWNEVTVTAWVAKGELVADAKGVWTYAGEMYNASCGMCHSLRAPNHYLANQWIGTLDAMKRFIALDKEEYRFLLKYLQLNAKDTGGAGAAH